MALGFGSLSISAAQLVGSPVDLLGGYTLPSSISGNGLVADTTDPAGINGAGMVVERSGGVATQEATLTPFSDAVKPPHALVADLRGHWLRADVDLGALSRWSAGDSFQLGLGSGGTGSPKIAAIIDRFGGAYRVTALASGGATTVFVGVGDETEFRLQISVNSANTLASVTTIPLNGSGSPSTVNIPLNVVADSASNIGFFVSGEGAPASRASASVLRMNTDAIADALTLFCDLPYVQPAQIASFHVDMAELAQPVYGFQAFLAKSGAPVAAIPNLTSGTYTSNPFPLWIINPITSTLNLASGTVFGDPPVQLDARLSDLAFQATGTEGIAQLGFRPNTPPTRFTAGTNGVIPNTQDSNIVVIDGTAPSLAIAQVEQNATILPDGGVIGKGLVTVSLSAADMGYLGFGSGLVGRPQVTLDYYPFGPSAGDVLFDVASGVGNAFVGTYNFTAANPSGKAHLVVTAVDRAGNVTKLQRNYLVKIVRLRS